jgi:hypothetical protein
LLNIPATSEEESSFEEESRKFVVEVICNIAVYEGESFHEDSMKIY